MIVLHSQSFNHPACHQDDPTWIPGHQIFYRRLCTRCRIIPFLSGSLPTNAVFVLTHGVCVSRTLVRGLCRSMHYAAILLVECFPYWDGNSQNIFVDFDINLQFNRDWASPGCSQTSQSLSIFTSAFFHASIHEGFTHQELPPHGPFFSQPQQ